MDRMATSTPWARTSPALESIGGSLTNRTLEFFLPRGDTDDLDLHAPYQRASVWTLDQRQALIKSLLLGITPAAVYLSTLNILDATSPIRRVVDGKQRIETIRQFMTGGFRVDANWFPDSCFDPAQVVSGTITGTDLTSQGRRVMENKGIPTIEIDFTTRWDRVESGTGTAGGNLQYRTSPRTESEVLVAEIEVYMLLNTAGTAHTDAEIATALAAATRAE